MKRSFISLGVLSFLLIMLSSCGIKTANQEQTILQNSTTQQTSLTINEKSSTTTTGEIAQTTEQTTTPTKKTSITQKESTTTKTTATKTKHVHKYEKAIVSPKCIEPGYTKYVCMCGDIYRDNYTEMLGHQWTYWKTVKKPTEKKAGKATCHCTVCGMEDSWEIPKVFAKKLEVCTFTNETFPNEDNENWAAVARMFACESNDVAAEKKIKKAFKAKFGFDATAKVTKKRVDVFTVEGYDEAQWIWEYEIFDTTYPLKDNEDYVVYHQTCTDGSPWVGFCVRATMDTLSEVTSTALFAKLEKQMYEEFEKATGKTCEEMSKNPDKYELGYISQAGTVRTYEGTLVDVLYIYCRSHAED